MSQPGQGTSSTSQTIAFTCTLVGWLVGYHQIKAITQFVSSTLKNALSGGVLHLLLPFVSRVVVVLITLVCVNPDSRMTFSKG